LLGGPWLLFDDEMSGLELPGLFAKNTGLIVGFFPFAIGIDFLGTLLKAEWPPPPVDLMGR
jgi:hypothetical protein